MSPYPSDKLMVVFSVEACAVDVEELTGLEACTLTEVTVPTLLVLPFQFVISDEDMP